MLDSSTQPMIQLETEQTDVLEFVALIAWGKTGFKCPLYIHVLAGLATALGFIIARNTDSSFPVNQWWLLGKWRIVGIAKVDCPASWH